MRKNLVGLLALATAGLASFASVGVAQNPSRDYAFGIRDAAAKADDDAYYFYSGELYANHAYDHADVLTQYAGLGRTIPVSVIEEHSGEIRNNLVAADKSYAKLTTQFKDNAEAEKHLKREHEHRLAAIKALDKLQADSKAGKSDPQAVAADAKTIQTELSASSGEHQRFLQKTRPATTASKQ